MAHILWFLAQLNVENQQTNIADRDRHCCVPATASLALNTLFATCGYMRQYRCHLGFS